MLELREAPVAARGVAYVDDERELLSAFARLLRREAFPAWTTTSPAEALAWLESRDVGLFISDQRMPEILGTELLDEVRRRAPRTARLLVTGYPGSTLLLRSAEPPVLLYKPWDDEALKRRIRTALQERPRA